VSETVLKKSSTDRQTPPPFFHSLFKASTLSHGSLYSCCCSLLFRIRVLKYHVTPRLSANFKTLMGLCLGSGSGSSACLKALYFRVSTRWPSVSSSSCVFSNATTFSASYIRICALRLIYWIRGQTTQV